MKKYLVFLLSVLFLLSSMSFVIADDGGMDSVRSMKPGAKVMLGGSARVRGIWKKNADYLSSDDDDDRFYDQRMRVKITGESGNGFSAKTRLKVANGALDSRRNTAAKVIAVDYAYITLPISSVTVKAGSMLRYFGHGFLTGQFDDGFDTVQVSGKFESVTVTAYTNKVVETSPAVAATVGGVSNAVTGTNNLKDWNDYGAILVADIGAIEAGATFIFHHDNRQTAGVDNDNGTDVGIYAKGKVGGIGVGAEIAFLTGDMNKSALDKTPFGLMAYASTSVGAVGVKVDVAYVTNTYTADNNYVPTLLIGTDQNTAQMNLGSNDDDKSYLIAGSVNTDIMDNVNVGAGVAYIVTGAAAGDQKLTEIDGRVKVQLSKNARWILEAAYGNPNDDLGADAVTVIANKAEVYF